MGGYSPKKVRKLIVGETASGRAQEGCDLAFRVDLVGVRTEVSKTLVEGDELDVTLLTRDEVRSVVCCKGKAVAGTLAAFRGLAQLISCLRQGHEYVALVEAVSSARCAVLVLRKR
jgi:hypothetical protein